MSSSADVVTDTSELAPTLDFRKEDLSRYAVTGRTEVLSYLHTMADQNLLSTLNFSNGSLEKPDFFVSSILKVDEFRNLLIIDSAQNPQLNLAITKAPSAMVEAVLDKIRISFILTGLKLFLFEGRHALQAVIPKRLIRLQRREHFRVAVPVMHPVECTVVVEKPEGQKALTLKPVDLSFGGFGLFDDHSDLEPASGQQYDNCRINLPGVGIIYASLRVTYVELIARANGQKKRRLGFGFVKLSNATGNLLQKYILLLEREQNAKRTGLGWNAGQTNIF